MSDKMPVIFVGHGNPMNAIEENEFSISWIEEGKALPRPKAILCISAHWETNGIRVSAMESPGTIYDFYGFPDELYNIIYPAPGSPELAENVVKILKKFNAVPDYERGFDHGCWSVLYKMFPDADIPVVQLSLDRTLTPQEHYDAGKQLSLLREQGVLVIGSGNIVHNLRMVVWEDVAFDWAVHFDNQVADWIETDNHNAIIHYEKYGKPAELSVNTSEHYLPLLYVLALKEKDEAVSFFADKIWGGSISMRSIRIG